MGMCHVACGVTQSVLIWFRFYDAYKHLLRTVTIISNAQLIPACVSCDRARRKWSSRRSTRIHHPEKVGGTLPLRCADGRAASLASCAWRGRGRRAGARALTMEWRVGVRGEHAVDGGEISDERGGDLLRAAATASGGASVGYKF